MGEDGPTGDQVPEELLGGLDARRPLGIVAGSVAAVVRFVRVGLGRLLVGALVGLARFVVRGVGFLTVILVVIAVDEILQPRPVDFVEIAGVALDLRRLQRDPLGEDETHPAAGAVGVDPL